MKIHKSVYIISTTILLFALCISCGEGITNKQEPWSQRMIRSEMQRSPQGWMLNFSNDLSWNYCHGLVCSAILDVSTYYNIDDFYSYVKLYADTMILDRGNIIGYRPEDYLLSGVTTGRILFPLYKREQEEKYKLAIQLLRNQLQAQPRTSEGGFWHKAINTSQIWLDGSYMALPFYAEYAQTFRETAIYDDVILQIELIRKYLYDPHTGLYRHGWDESREQRWADAQGQSPHTWGRALGWFAMGLTDVLDYIPQDHPKREEMLIIYKELMEAVINYQDKKSGLWYQVVDMPSEKGNYQESSASCMLTYALLKGINKGYIDRQPYLTAAQKAYSGILKHFIVKKKGQLSITECCEVAGLGGKPYRDGSFEYYIHIPRRENDPKAVGSFILASLEMERLSN